MDLKNAPYPDIAAEFLGIEVSEDSTKPIIDDNDEQDKNKEAAQSELNNNFGGLPMRNQNDDRRNYFNLMGNPDEPKRLEIIEQPLQNQVPENVTKIEDTSDAEELEVMEMHHNNEDDDDPINDRYEITGVDDEEYDDDTTGVQEAQNDNIDVNLGRQKKEIKKPSVFH